MKVRETSSAYRYSAMHPSRWRHALGYMDIQSPRGQFPRRTECRSAMSQSTQRRETDQSSAWTEPADGLDARFREVMDAAPVMIWVSGEDKGCVWFNKPWLTFTGRPLAEEIGSGWSKGVHSHDFDRCMNIYLSHFDA